MGPRFPPYVRLVVASFFTGGVQVKYSAEFIEQALVKVHTRGGRTLRQVADDLGVNFYTIQKWLKVRKIVRTDVENREKRPDEWQREEQLTALLETHGLGDEALNAWCRERGLFPHHLQQWRAAFALATPHGPKRHRRCR
jgi:transposase